MVTYRIPWLFCGPIKICNSRIVHDTDWTSSTCIGHAGSTLGKHGLWRVLARLRCQLVVTVTMVFNSVLVGADAGGESQPHVHVNVGRATGSQRCTRQPLTDLMNSLVPACTIWLQYISLHIWLYPQHIFEKPMRLRSGSSCAGLLQVAHDNNLGRWVEVAYTAMERTMCTNMVLCRGHTRSPEGCSRVWGCVSHRKKKKRVRGCVANAMTTRGDLQEVRMIFGFPYSLFMVTWFFV
jgi:hypothetical protein